MNIFLKRILESLKFVGASYLVYKLIGVCGKGGSKSPAYTSYQKAPMTCLSHLSPLC